MPEGSNSIRAPLSTALELSAMEPEMTPLPAWAKAGTASSNRPDNSQLIVLALQPRLYRNMQPLSLKQILRTGSVDG
jgi:hypothetical protein